MRARVLLLPTVISVVATLLLVPADAAITPAPPVTISGAGPGSVSMNSNVLEVDASGRAVAVWLQDVAGVLQLRSAERSAAGTWSPSIDLTTGPVPVAGFDFDLNEAGDAAVVFRRFDGSGQRLWGVYRAAGSPTWGSASSFGGLVHGVGTSYGVAVMSDGTAVSAYIAPDGPSGELSTTDRAYAGQGSAGGWSGDVFISSTGHLPVNGDQEDRDVTDVAIAADGTGTAQVLMRMEAHSELTFGTRYRLMRASRTTSTGWTTVTPFTSLTEPEYAVASGPRIEGDETGGGYVEVWSELDENSKDVVVASVGGDRQTFQDDDGVEGTSDDMFSAEMSMRNGVAAINTIYNAPANVGQDSVARVGTAVWRSGTGWSALMDPVEDPQYGATRPRLSVHTNGTISQTYDTGIGTSTNVLVSQLPPVSSTWTTDRNVSVYAENKADFRASIAGTTGADAIVIWSRNQGSSVYTVEASSFTSDVTPSPSPTTTTPTATPTETASPTETPGTTAPTVAPTVAPPATTPPVATAFVKGAPPSVSGKARVGKTLKAKPGVWQPVPTKVTYQWRAGTKNIKKATKPTLKLTAALKGKRISVRVTVSAPGLPSVTTTVKVKGRVR